MNNVIIIIRGRNLYKRENIMKKSLLDKQAFAQLEKGFSNAEKVLNDGNKINKLFSNLNKKLQSYPKIAEKVANIPVLIEMVKAYVSKKYTKIPVKSIIAIVSALIYLVVPTDLIPDFIPGIGLVDDFAVLRICIELVNMDIIEFKKWRESNLISAVKE